ncbi:MAG: hypothetical protein A2882_14535 [Phenylobacterium sp. RIFCSPHIGHO2_01_FULL_70_10]|nr:MAG: hypothetical protein A2882_14535 [Phenylobacterium sp. RIFCSPHIGHO2_01_FULL_70_10]
MRLLQQHLHRAASAFGRPGETQGGLLGIDLKAILADRTAVGNHAPAVLVADDGDGDRLYHSDYLL